MGTSTDCGDTRNGDTKASGWAMHCKASGGSERGALGLPGDRICGDAENLQTGLCEGEACQLYFAASRRGR